MAARNASIELISAFCLHSLSVLAVAPAERGGSALPKIPQLRRRFRAFHLLGAKPPIVRDGAKTPVEERNAVLARYREECQNAVKNAG